MTSQREDPNETGRRQGDRLVQTALLRCSNWHFPEKQPIPFSYCAEVAEPREYDGACGKLNDFISAVQAQSGKGLTVAQANDLIATANQIKAGIGCK